MKNYFFIILSTLLISCSSNGPKIIIEKEYIVNKHWNDYNNSILIEKLKIKEDSLLDIFDKDFNKNWSNHYNITSKLEVDSLFIHGYNGLNINYDKLKLKDTIFFNRDNGASYGIQILIK